MKGKDQRSPSWFARFGLVATLLPACLMGTFLVGCDPNVTSLTTAPPTAVAELDSWECDVRLSQGIALAVECLYLNEPCENATASSSDSTIVQVFPSYVDLLAPGDVYQRPASDEPRSVFVLVGGSPGNARVSISSGDGDVELAVTTLALP